MAGVFEEFLPLRTVPTYDTMEQRTVKVLANKKPDSETKRPAIKRAAMKLMCQYGYDGTSVQMIAREANATAGLVIKYYQSKQALAALCIQEFLEQFMRRIQLSAADPSSYDAHTARVFRLFERSRDEWRFLLVILLTPAHAQLASIIFPKYVQVSRQLVGSFGEVKPGDVSEVAYTMSALYFCFVLGGNTDNYIQARNGYLARILETPPSALAQPPAPPG